MARKRMLEKDSMTEAASMEPRADNVSPRMRPRRALIISLTIPFLLYLLLLAMLGENVFLFTRMPDGRESRAALAIRDDVFPFLQWGTRLFTQPYLRKYYAEYWYFTQAADGQHEHEFTAALAHALATYPNVDLYLLAHTNKYIKWVETLPESQRQRIRFVYNTGCYNEKQGPDWLALGANTYIGHPGVSLSPFFYFFLLRHWTQGATLAETLELGNRRMCLKFRQMEIVSRGRFDATHAMRESIASCVGNADLRLEDTP